MELNDTQSALILEVTNEGEISVEIATKNFETLASALCQAIAAKLVNDEDFQNDLMEMIDMDE
ncbi:twitching motility protein [Desulforhopalus singaporensis]|uniref:Uncharacterized protein n=1 Tax=Desulforhopalus singaporensis TaxID=91360 RepID=A0A1H0M7S9_9BACT|nr:twitching motility protein [Desulforhopalus singaporensis]SDO76160.1 hypothetical protein SAMN05660330_01006 [Desulforhopalus singaporensis]